MVVPPWYELPPSGYGGIELICAALIDALCARGHDVTMFGAGRRTGTAARFVSTLPEPQYERLGEAMPDALHAARVTELLADSQFDVVHDHSLSGPLTAGHRSAPTVVTVHGPADGELGDYYVALGEHIHPVAISDSQRRQRPEIRWAATIHNAIDPAQFVPAHRSQGPVLWLARFSPDKGPDLAIEACRKADLPLVLAGKCNELSEQRYLDAVIRPLLGDDVTLIVNGDRATTNRMLTEARCLIMPIRWHEPFGMVMIEAMASGTPVVALRRGSVPEIVRHGTTGWICDEQAELPEALHRVSELDPDECVAHARSAFGAARMARRYERVYRQAITYARRPRRGVRRPTALAPTRILSTVGERRGVLG
ncbi:glycosyltransferase family 4 protein [Planosporangium flavigriseum]|uniref:Glycosyl transferase n=2 Tax=Planosporangium flavigriseum TaxID=373681 RepID=A0A8J3LN20_9ACTN|nr:glycosyltransferase family 4 protein [Planosporangium flavigriseum]NJC63786.1 glycosyltransferase family 4 protein [Planosporangium flavigriseum]GIG73715.1 glycosyl transferase [Planosporangium flavigriseum]